VSVRGWGREFYSGNLFLVSTMFNFLLYIVRTNILFSCLWGQVLYSCNFCCVYGVESCIVSYKNKHYFAVKDFCSYENFLSVEWRKRHKDGFVICNPHP
jgi:hypothetical protein